MLLNDGAQQEIPLAFGMSLARNASALRAFSRLPEPQRQSVLKGACSIRSRQEMEQYIRQLEPAAEDEDT